MLKLKQLKPVSGRLYLPKDQWKSEWAEGHVILQTPLEGTLTQADATVAIWSVHEASASDALVEVPEVIGQSMAAAQSAIQDAGLESLIVRRTPTDEETSTPEVVLDQYPKAAQVVGPTTAVLLHVSQ